MRENECLVLTYSADLKAWENISTHLADRLFFGIQKLKCNSFFCELTFLSFDAKNES